MSWLAGVGSILSAGSSLFGGLLGSSGQAAANAQQQAQFEQQQAGHAMEYWNNIDESWKFQRDNQRFATEMANTAYQRATADMRAAGLNPILAYQQGGANAPTSSGSVPGSPGMPGMTRMENAMGPLAAGVTSAGKAAETFTALRNLSSLTDKAEQDTKRSAAETDLTKDQSSLTKSQDDVAKATKVLTEVNQDKSRQETATSAAQAAAALSAAQNNNQDTANKAVQNEILRHEAVTARAKAENASAYGPGTYGDIVSTVNRTGATTFGSPSVNEYIYKNYAQPVREFLGGLYNRWKGKP